MYRDGEYHCRWCDGPCGRRATYCSDRCRVYGNRVDVAYRRGELRACPWYGPPEGWTPAPRVVRVPADGITTWHVVRMRTAS